MCETARESQLRVISGPAAVPLGLRTQAYIPFLEKAFIEAY
jgi:hypothetical protein